MGGFWKWLLGIKDKDGPVQPPRSAERQAKVDKAMRIAYDNAATQADQGDVPYLAEALDDEDTAKALYELVAEGDRPWASLTERQRLWWRNRGRHTRRHSYCWEANVSGYWQYAGDLLASGFNADGHPLDDNPRGSLYHLAKNREREIELMSQQHDPITAPVRIFDTSDTPTGPEYPPRIVMSGGEYVSSTVNIAEPIGGYDAQVVTDRCQDDCIACGIERRHEAERWSWSQSPVTQADLDRLELRLAEVENKLGIKRYEVEDQIAIYAAQEIEDDDT